jgi:PBP1b-binding outer membrane lipoprotein LpoB
MKIIFLALLLSGCATTSNYQIYTDTQKNLNKDYTMAELARISALTEIVKDSTDVSIRIQAIKALQEIQSTRRPLVIEQPKKNIFGF